MEVLDLALVLQQKQQIPNILTYKLQKKKQLWKLLNNIEHLIIVIKTKNFTSLILKFILPKSKCQIAVIFDKFKEGKQPK